jgi:hypothetical protein
MDRDEIRRIVESYLEQDMDGQEIENPKCDFKARWYNLSETNGISEFLKDSSAIANTFGPDGFIIIGYDSKKKAFEDASFSDSGLRDSSLLSDLINKRIDRLFDIAVYDFVINENKVSVLHIPPSIDKPHVIRNHKTSDKAGNAREEQHRIFVRKGTSTYPASKNDIELMFYDRKNIVPDYKILCSYHVDTLSINANSFHNGSARQITETKANMSLVLENLGKRPVAIIEVKLSFTLFEDPSPYEVMEFETGYEYRGSEIIIQPNEIQAVSINLISYFHSKVSYEDAQNFITQLNKSKARMITRNITLVLSTGESLKCELTYVA